MQLLNTLDKGYLIIVHTDNAGNCDGTDSMLDSCVTLAKGYLVLMHTADDDNNDGEDGDGDPDGDRDRRWQWSVI